VTQFTIFSFSLLAGFLICCVNSGCGSGGDDSEREQSGPAKQDNTDNSSTTSARFFEKGELTFQYRNGQIAGHCSIVESLGGGAAVLDYDRDGDLDICLAGGGYFAEGPVMKGHPLGLFRNEGNWQFTEVTNAAGLGGEKQYTHGVTVGDYDNDGFPDILVTGCGGLALYQNQQDGTFTDVTVAAGLLDTSWSSSAAWGDINGDGNLDLYVAHYVNWSWKNHPFCPGPKPGLREVCPPKKYDALPDLLYISDGNGAFRDVSVEAGLRRDGKGLGVVIGDLDLDGDLDIYVANDTEPNALYQNQGKGKFRDISMMSGSSLDDTGRPQGSMGVDLCDFNRDGLPDLWVANYENESFGLYQNQGEMMFQPVSRSTGITSTGKLYVGWGTAFFDFDRDGDEDVFVSNGHVIRYPQAAPLKQQPLLFENQDGNRFRDVAGLAGDYLEDSHMGRGVACGDLDNNHTVDLVVSHINDPVALLSNESKTEHGWLEIQLIGTVSSRDPVGAHITVELDDSTVMWRQCQGGGSYASTNTPVLHFGIPQQRKIKSISVLWPSGLKQELEPDQENRKLLLVEGNSPLLAKP